MDGVRKAIRFSKGEWNRQVSMRKFTVIFLCMAVLLYIYTGNLPGELKKSQMSIGILELFPLYWNKALVPDLLFGGFLLLVCDVPSRGLGMRSHVMRSGRGAYYFGEMLYIAEMTLFYLLFIWGFTMLLVMPGVSFQPGWSDAVKNGIVGGSSSAFVTVGNYVYLGTPAGRFFSCFLLVSLCCFFMAALCSVINIVTGSTVGCAVCAVFMLLDIVMGQLLQDRLRYPVWIYFFSPITVVDIYTGRLNCPLWAAAAYYIVLSSVTVGLGAVAVKKSDI